MSGPAPGGPGLGLTVAEVLKVFLPEYLRGQAVPAREVKLLQRLARCRSGELGWTLWHCADCDATHWRPQGCGDRHCPSCQHQRSEAWLEKQRQALLPVRYYHWVFTVPAPLRPLMLQNPAVLYRLLFDAASATLLQFGQERFQAELGITAILHTWGQNLMHHPHLHCLVTGGGLTPEDKWSGPKQARWLFPVGAVASMFRGKFCAGLLQLHTTGKLEFHGELAHWAEPAAFRALLGPLQSRRWVVFAKGSVVGPDRVLEYLGRYTHRVAITNRRLRRVDGPARTVTFAYRDYADGDRIKEMTLSGGEFIRRFRMHLLPRGFTKIRHYGLLGNNRRTQRVPLARAALSGSRWQFAGEPAARSAAPAATRISCPHCQGGAVRCIGRVSRNGEVTLFARLRLLLAAPPCADTS